MLSPRCTVTPSSFWDFRMPVCLLAFARIDTCDPGVYNSRGFYCYEREFLPCRSQFLHALQETAQ